MGDGHSYQVVAVPWISKESAARRVRHLRSRSSRGPRARQVRPGCVGRRLAEARGSDHGHVDRRRAAGATSRAAGEAAIAAVMAEMHRIDATMSPHKADSELSHRQRATPPTAPVPVSAGMFGLLSRALAFSQLSGGAFDITFASVGHLYDYRAGVAPERGRDRWPRAAAVDWRHLQLDAAPRTRALRAPGRAHRSGRLRQGPCGRQRHRRSCAGCGIRHAMVAAGGDSHVMGAARPPVDGRHSRPAPRRRGGGAAAAGRRLDLDLGRLRALLRARRRALPSLARSAHRPLAASVRSVTIIADDGLTTRGASPRSSSCWAWSGNGACRSPAGVDAVIVDAQGALHFSSGLLG